MRRHRRRSEPTEWGRRKLLALMVGVVVAAVLLLVGVGLAVFYALQPGASAAAGRLAQSRSVADPRDALAAHPMPSAAAEDARPGQLTSNVFGSLSLPNGRRVGAAGVSTGFPPTVQGALAQLIAVDQAALESASVPGAQEVIRAWARPGGPTSQSWSGVRAVAEMLSAAELPAQGSPSFTVSATPAMGLVKGSVGGRYVVGCVDFVVTATASTTATVAAADCQRMVWTQNQTQRQLRTQTQTERRIGRGLWMIGPGSEPAAPPSLWPGTEAARRAGYLWLTFEE